MSPTRMQGGLDVIPCLFSVSYAGLWGQAALSVPEFLRKARQLGYPAVMLMAKRPHLSPLDASDEVRARWQAALAETGVRCAVLGAYTDFSGTGAAEVPHLEMQIAYVESVAQLAQSLGAGLVRVFTAYENPAVPLAAVWSRTIAALRECCDRAAAYGVTIAVQNHHDLAVHSDVLLELLGDIDRPNCKVGYDAWSPALRGEDLFESAHRLAPHAVCTTNADYVRLPRYRYQPDLVNYLPAVPDWIRAVP
ncbi:MAG: sugar phosphate isomerase/epimerase, partial [Planctomycetes bacterium]|nr:sugar phosphate isomerase/epimerase [Planctomycetota bacterium]